MIKKNTKFTQYSMKSKYSLTVFNNNMYLLDSGYRIIFFKRE